MSDNTTKSLVCESCRFGPGVRTGNVTERRLGHDWPDGGRVAGELVILCDDCASLAPEGWLV